MRQRVFTHWAVAMLAVATLAIGCASSGGGDETAPASTDFGGDSSASMGDSAPAETPTGLEAVYFDFDSAAIRGDQRPTLQANVGAINQNAGWKTVVLEGHCDERGSEEYNLALGERRANSVKQYLVDSGVTGGAHRHGELRREQARRAGSRRVGLEVESPRRVQRDPLEQAAPQAKRAARV